MALFKLSYSAILTLDGIAYGAATTISLELSDVIEGTIALTNTYKTLYDSAASGGGGTLRLAILVNTGAEIAYGRIQNAAGTTYMPFAIPVSGHIYIPQYMANDVDTALTIVDKIAARTTTTAGRLTTVLGFA